MESIFFGSTIVNDYNELAGKRIEKGKHVLKRIKGRSKGQNALFEKHLYKGIDIFFDCSLDAFIVNGCFGLCFQRFLDQTRLADPAFSVDERGVVALLHGSGKLRELLRSCYKQKNHLYTEFKFSENNFS